VEEIGDHEISIRPIEKSDEAGIANVIHSVLEEYGGNAPGFAGSDRATEQLFTHYNDLKGEYYVIKARGKLWGGGGFAPLDGAAEEWCELQKMYFLEPIRGKGLSKEIMDRCLSGAQKMGYRFMYLETLSNMDVAQGLYKSYGFDFLDAPKGNTGHFGCNIWMSRAL
jgi:putative acetyltransferase